ncbi:hypothetical protein EV178_000145 [Coemansia sp. RSA 1646]|nr:hypothetical protein EV178_000145 [Coemansia sp. RSA 1646]
MGLQSQAQMNAEDNLLFDSNVHPAAASGPYLVWHPAFVKQAPGFRFERVIDVSKVHPASVVPVLPFAKTKPQNNPKPRL